MLFCPVVPGILGVGVFAGKLGEAVEAVGNGCCARFLILDRADDFNLTGLLAGLAIVDTNGHRRWPGPGSPSELALYRLNRWMLIPGSRRPER